MGLEKKKSVVSENSRVILIREKKTRKGCKKSLFPLKGIDRAAGRVVEAQAGFADEVCKAHLRSNRRKRSGWLRDLPTNIWRVTRKSLKKAKPSLRDLFPF